MESKLTKIINAGFLVSPDLEIKEEHIEDFLKFLKTKDPKPIFVTNELK